MVSGIVLFLGQLNSLISLACQVWTDMMAAKDKLSHARQVMVKWLKDHSQLEVWEGTTLAQIAMAVSGVARFSDWLTKMGCSGHWLDTAAMFGLASAFDADVAIFIEGQEPCLLGASLANIATDLLIPVALANDRHFWATKILSDEDDVVQFVDKGDFVRLPHEATPRKGSVGASEDFGRHDDRHYPDIEGRISAELSLCEAMLAWNPFAAPSPAVMVALQRLSAAMVGNAGPEMAAAAGTMGRQMALAQLQLENAAAEVMEPRLTYQRAKNRLRAALCGSYRLGKSRAEHAAASLRMAAFTDPKLCADIVSQKCETRQTDHVCMIPFRAHVDAVRNWRILWLSYPPRVRKEVLLTLFRETAGRPLTILGHEVCTAAFKIITGVGSSTLQEVREAVAAQKVAFYSHQELSMFMDIKLHAKAGRYLDARAWLEVYAETHAEQSPSNGHFVLPHGRRSLYYLAYRHDRMQEDLAHLDGECANQVTFMEAWRVELPHVVVGEAMQV